MEQIVAGWQLEDVDFINGLMILSWNAKIIDWEFFVSVLSEHIGMMLKGKT